MAIQAFDGISCARAGSQRRNGKAHAEIMPECAQRRREANAHSSAGFGAFRNIAANAAFRARGMERYNNGSGDSGVVAYAVGTDFIVVEFRDGGTYRYDYASTGKAEVEQMKRLAVLGRGLATYINTAVRERFAEKLP